MQEVQVAVESPFAAFREFVASHASLASDVFGQEKQTALHIVSVVLAPLPSLLFCFFFVFPFLSSLLA